MTTSAPAKEPAAGGGDLARKLADVHVGLRRDVLVTRQIVRGEPRYVVHDPVTFRNHLFSDIEYRIFGALAAQRSLCRTFAALQQQGVLQAEDAEEFYGFVVGLHGMGLLHLPGFPVEALHRRHVMKQRSRQRPGLAMLMSWRVPLGNPNQLLARLLPLLGEAYSVRGLLAWLALTALAVWQCGGRAGELFADPAGLLALANLPVLWCSLVVLKVLHELGHAIAIKRFGGDVPECGLLFVMLTPCAYVDANASWTFPSRWHRVVVALGGVWFESFVAAGAALLYAGTQPGLLHDIARNVVFLATVTTLLVNINPLVRYDGYFLLSDLLGIVNLGQRSTRHVGACLEHWLLGLPRPADDAPRFDRLVYWAYAPATLLYRIGIAVGITAMMLTRWPSVGLVLGVLFGWKLLVLPVRELLVHLWHGERTAPVRLRARAVAVAGLLLTTLLFAWLPMSFSIVAPGVLDPGVRRVARAPTSAIVDEVLVRDGQHVEAGTRLCRLRDQELLDQLQAIEAEVQAAAVDVDVTELGDPTVAAARLARLQSLRERAADLASRAAMLDVSLPIAGTVAHARTVAPGDFVHVGDELLQVHSDHALVRVVLAEVEWNRAELEIGSEAELRWSCEPTRTVRAVVKEIHRSASRRHVPVELTMSAGGRIYARAIGPDAAAEADQPYLHVFLAADSVPLPGTGTGLTAAVRFPARVETLGQFVKRQLLVFAHNWRTL